MYRGNGECELQRVWFVQTVGNKPPFDCDLENLDRKKISVSKWLVKLKAEEGIMRSSGWVLKTENMSEKK